MEYNTVGGKGEATNATGGIMVPKGTDAVCTGARPVLLYSHGTTVEKATTYCQPGQQRGRPAGGDVRCAGFIVVTSNYAGYDASRLPYHPYLNAEQQSNDMVDALRAARKAFPNIGASDSGKLFLSGYSQGWSRGDGNAPCDADDLFQRIQVTAAGPMSGPYSLVKTFQTVYAAVSMQALLYSRR